MNKEELVGLLAGLCLMGLIIVGYPMAGLLCLVVMLACLVLVVYPIIGIVWLISTSSDFREFGYWYDFFGMAFSVFLIVYSFITWSLVLGWL